MLATYYMQPSKFHLSSTTVARNTFPSIVVIKHHSISNASSQTWIPTWLNARCLVIFHKLARLYRNATCLLWISGPSNMSPKCITTWIRRHTFTGLAKSDVSRATWRGCHLHIVVHWPWWVVVGFDTSPNSECCACHIDGLKRGNPSPNLGPSPRL